MDTPISRIASHWDKLPRWKQILIEKTMDLASALFLLEEAVMGGKSKAPGIILALVSIAYIMFALVFFRAMPEIVLTAGYVLGAVHISIFLISLFTRGKNNCKDK